MTLDQWRVRVAMSGALVLALYSFWVAHLNDRLTKRNTELSKAVRQYILASALYAQENQRLAGQLSWCLNTPLAGTHPQGQDAAEVRREQSLAGSSPE